jgi:type II secretory pathway pseudopilin PulG
MAMGPQQQPMFFQMGPQGMMPMGQPGMIAGMMMPVGQQGQVLQPNGAPAFMPVAFSQQGAMMMTPQGAMMVPSGAMQQQLMAMQVQQQQAAAAQQQAQQQQQQQQQAQQAQQQAAQQAAQAPAASQQSGGGAPGAGRPKQPGAGLAPVNLGLGVMLPPLPASSPPDPSDPCLKSVFDYEADLPEEIPSPPPLPPDFHEDPFRNAPALFNFEQFTKPLPSRSEAQALRPELGGGLFGGSGSGSLDDSCLDMAIEDKSDADILHLLFGPPQELPRMATVHLHKFKAEQADSGGDADAEALGLGLGGGADAGSPAATAAADLASARSEALVPEVAEEEDGLFALDGGAGGGMPRSDSFFVMKRSDSFLNMGSPMFRFDEVEAGSKQAAVAAFKQPRGKLPLGKQAQKQAHKQLQEEGGDLFGLMDPLGSHPPASPAFSLGALLGTPAMELPGCRADAPAGGRLKCEPDAAQHILGPLGARQPASSDAAGIEMLPGRKVSGLWAELPARPACIALRACAAQPASLASWPAVRISQQRLTRPAPPCPAHRTGSSRVLRLWWWTAAAQTRRCRPPGPCTCCRPGPRPPGRAGLGWPGAMDPRNPMAC